MQNELAYDYLELMDLEEQPFTQPRVPVEIASADGLLLTDVNGKTYLDYTSGADNCSLGFAHPAVTTSLQSSTALPTALPFLIATPEADTLAEKLTGLTQMHRCYFSNTAVEALDTAFKIILTYSTQQFAKNQKDEIVMISGSKRQSGVNVFRLKDNTPLRGAIDLNHLELLASHSLSSSVLMNIVNKRTCALVIQPVCYFQDEFITDTDLIHDARALCDRLEIPLVFDCTNFSLGRSGQLLPYTDIEPDILLLSKGLAQGYPLSAVLVNESIETGLNEAYQHPYRCMPVCYKVVTAVLDKLSDPELLASITQKANLLAEKIDLLRESSLSVVDIQQKGLFAYLEMDFSLDEFVRKALEEGIILELEAYNVLKIAPAFTITDEHVEKLYNVLNNLLLQMRPDFRLK